MKKIFSFLLCLATMTLSVSCGDDDTNYQGTTPLTITLADVLFGPSGGDGSIVANTTSALTASTDAAWVNLTVNGNTVTVTAAPNGSLEARSAKIVVNAADGTTASVVATQHGMLLNLMANDSYQFLADDSQQAIIADKSNVDFNMTISADWIHVEKVEDGYGVTVDPNEGNYRVGNITLTFAEFSKKIAILQWGTSYPFADLNTATYNDEDGIEYTKSITVVPDASSEGAWRIQGLLDEGDIVFAPNPSDVIPSQEWIILPGYSPGTLTEGNTTYTLRCLISAYNSNTGNRYYPTTISPTISNASNSAYRIAFDWAADPDGNVLFNYIRNSSLGTNYTTDGFIVCKFRSPSSAAASFRSGIAYSFLNLKLSIQ